MIMQQEALLIIGLCLLATALAWGLAREWHLVGQLFLDKGWLQRPISPYPYWGLVVLFILIGWREPDRLSAAICLVFVFGLYQLAYFDAKTGFLPDRWTLALLWAALLVNSQSWYTSSDQAVLGAAVGYGALWLLNIIYLALRKRPGLGGGDMKLLAVLGALFGWSALPYLLFIASALGLIFVVIRRFLKKNMSTSIAFGPFLAAAGIAWLGTGL